MVTTDHHRTQNQPNDNNDDNISVATTTTNNRTISGSTEVKEYVVKFLFRPKQSGNNTKVAQTHYAILCVITDIYPKAQVFDNFGSMMREFPSLKSYDAYLRHFKLQFVKSNEQKQRSSIYLAFHHIRSRVPIGEIRSDSSISSLLHKVNTRLTIHHWKEDETRIANLGFHVGVDLSNCLKQTFEECIRTQIANATGQAKKNIPKFCCSYTSPFIVDNDGVRTATKLYDLQCRQSDAKELVQMLQTTYNRNPTFIFHKLRHKNPVAYTKAICSQNVFLANTRVIPIQGIDENVMFYLENDLLQEVGLHDILPHNDTATKDRWSIITTTQHFKTLLATLREHLAGWAMFYAQEHPMDANLPAIGLAFCTQPYENASDTSFNTYSSACSSIYTVDDEEFDRPPVASLPAPQVWGTPHTLAPSQPSQLPTRQPDAHPTPGHSPSDLQTM